MNIAAIELWGLRCAAIAAVMAGLFIRGCYYGGEQVQAKWDKANVESRIALEKINASNRQIEAARQARVSAAESAAAQAQLDLSIYRRAHPVSVLVGGVRAPAAGCNPADSGKGAGDSATTATGETARVLQPSAPRDIGSDLDALMAEADVVNDAYGICLATRP